MSISFDTNIVLFYYFIDSFSGSEEKKQEN